MTQAQTDPILPVFRAGLERTFGDRLARVVLFGSRARGDEQPDSDYDIAIFLRGVTDRWAEFDRIVPVIGDILYTRGASIQALVYDDSRYNERSSLMRDIREEGIDL